MKYDLPGENALSRTQPQDPLTIRGAEPAEQLASSQQ
jgi:hypothetical protein